MHARAAADRRAAGGDALSAPALIAVPNISSGRDPAFLDALSETYARAGARVLDVHADPDHDRSVFTLAAPPRALAAALVAGARHAAQQLDVFASTGIHPHVGALDVAPVVFLDDDQRGPACAEALVAAHEIGALGIPVLLYGLLAGGRTRAELRAGGPARMAQRVLDGDPAPDFGPRHAHATAGTTLVAARPPLVAFNLELAPPATHEDARRIAALVREGGPEGLPGVRAIGLTLAHRDDVAQVSCNVEDHRAVPLAALVQAVARHARIQEAEVIGLPPRAAFDGFPDDLPCRNRRTLEDALSGTVS